MHLHGFYYIIESRGTWASDTIYGPRDRRLVVTEMMLPGGTMTMRWTPGRPGNWFFHCHFSLHISHFVSLEKVPDPVDPGAPDAVDYTVGGMRGMILGIHVRPARASSPPEVARPEPRPIRLLVQASPHRYGNAEGYGYLVQQGGVAARRDSVLILSSPLLLRRGEPVRITVVNHLRAPTAVHWHGIELQSSYFDGVAGWSGVPGRLARLVAPEDSFVAEFTPPRAGTFIYHSHLNEGHQIASGLYGALIVLEPGAEYDTTTDRTFIVGGNGPDFQHGRVNGQLDPVPLDFVAERTYRLRLININPDWRVFLSLLSEAGLLQWRAVAKDGADLPPPQAYVQPARCSCE